MSGGAGFDSWDALLRHLRAGGAVRYQAPMDRTARWVLVKKIYKNGKLRIDPLSNDADPFTADAGHLDRFRRA